MRKTARTVGGSAAAQLPQHFAGASGGSGLAAATLSAEQRGTCTAKKQPAHLQPLRPYQQPQYSPWRRANSVCSTNTWSIGIMDCTRCLLITLPSCAAAVLLSPCRRGERQAAASRMSATAPTLRDVYQFTLGQLTEQEQKSLATAFSAVSAPVSVA